MNVLMLTKWGMSEHGFYAFYNKFQKLIDVKFLGTSFGNEMGGKGKVLIALEADGKVVKYSYVEEGLKSLSDASSTLEIVSTEKIVVEVPERLPMTFHLFLATGMSCEGAVTHKTFDQLESARFDRRFEYAHLITPPANPGPLQLHPSAEQEWVKHVSRKTQEKIGLFRKFVGNYQEQPLEVLFIGLPKPKRGFTEKEVFILLERELRAALTDPKYKPPKKWYGLLEMFASMGEVMRYRVPSELELLKPEWKGPKPPIAQGVIPLFVLFTYRPEIEGETITSHDIRETRLWCQYKNEAI